MSQIKIQPFLFALVLIPYFTLAHKPEDRLFRLLKRNPEFQKLFG